MKRRIIQYLQSFLGLKHHLYQQIDKRQFGIFKKPHFRKKLIVGKLIMMLVVCAEAQELEIRPISFSEPPIGILGMAQDQFGYIWMSDNGNGLYKYDGKSTMLYKPEPNNTNSISSGRIENVFIDRDGILWLPHFETGLDRFDPETETFTHYRHDDLDTNTICSDATRDIVEDLQGNLWIGTNLGVDKLDKATGKFTHHFSDSKAAKILREEHVRKMYLDRSGIIWVGTGSAFHGEETTGGLFRLDPESGEVELFRHSDDQNSLIDNRVRAIFEDSRGVFWVGTAGDGLHTMDRETGTFTRHTYDATQPEKLSRPPTVNVFNFGVDHITFISEDEEGFIWIGTFGNGLNRYDPNTGITRHYGPNEKDGYYIGNAAYWDILNAKDHALWLSTFYVHGSTSSMMTRIDVTPDRVDYFELNEAQYGVEDSQGQLYVGTTEGVQVVNHDEPEYLFRISRDNGAEQSYVREIAFDDSGNIWAGTFGAGLYYFDRESGALNNYRHQPGNPNSISSDYVGSILIRENHEIYIGTSAGLDILNTEIDSFQHFELMNVNFGNATGLRKKLVAIDGQDLIWVGGSGGIFRFNRSEGTFTKYNLGIGNEIVMDMLVDANGILWIGTINHGLRRYQEEDDIFQVVLDETGYLSRYSFVPFVVQDSNDMMWFASDSRFVKYDVESNQGTLFGSQWLGDPGRYRFVDMITLRNGENLLATQTEDRSVQGFFRFHPNDYIHRDATVQTPFIQKLIINSKTQSTDVDGDLYESFRNNASIELAYHQNDLGFQIGYIDYDNDQSAQSISYKLTNYDRDWRHTTSGNYIDYYQLPPGSYELAVKAQDIYGNWGVKKLAIRIAVPWYKSWGAYMMYLLLFFAGIMVVDRYQRRRLLKKAREESLERELAQAREIKNAYDQLEQAHAKLKSTQSQLIQSEKMASLGELTAGIAHEIQNPLNFVNNFSEINRELVEELKEAIGNNNVEEVHSILGDLAENERKVAHHGRRAEQIVKSMLQHSRTSDGDKVLTDLNTLCDEYVRLAYHGIRARDKSFSAQFELKLDPHLPQIEVVPQDIGRVVLNLVNNAFQAIAAQGNGKVIVKTHHDDGGIFITVKDNGPGIPEEIKEKIFQPFFTTKPTGHGTGLGLSMSYDIVTNGHGGELKLKSNSGKGCTFEIMLPL